MNVQMRKAIMMAENINDFIKYVRKSYEDGNILILNRDKWFQVKLFVEEYRFQIIADELLRINQYDWDEKYTYYLVGEFKKGIETIDEYIKNNYGDLFILTARLHILKNLISSFSKSNSIIDL